ncbi:MAG: aldo/keto reductase [Rhizomicrobium sp.]
MPQFRTLLDVIAGDLLMLYRKFGSAPSAVSLIGQGTWRIERTERSRSDTKHLKRGIDLGMTHIDTAERYGFGVVEEIVAEATAGLRQEVFLVSKVLPDNARADECAAIVRELSSQIKDR